MSLPTQNFSLSPSPKQLLNSHSQMNKMETEQNRLTSNKQKLSALEKQVDDLRTERATKINTLDDLNRLIKKYKDHQEMLPLIKELRAHYRKLKEHMGEEDDLDVDNMSYQQLLQLGDKIGKVSKGISEKQFLELERQCCMITQQCSICQDDLILGAQCIKLKCGHMYDVDCLKEWVKMEKVCPLCKTQIS